MMSSIFSSVDSAGLILQVIQNNKFLKFKLDYNVIKRTLLTAYCINELITFWDFSNEDLG
jgi:hypothetical protein